MQACAEEARGQLPTNGKGGDCYDIAICGNTPPLSLVEAPLVPQLVAWFQDHCPLAIAGEGCQELPIKEACFVRVCVREEWVCENVKRRRERGVAAMGSSPAAICSRMCELEVEWYSSMYLLYPFSISK